MKWSEMESALKIIKFPAQTYVLILSLTCQLEQLTHMHPLSCEFNLCKMFKLQKFLSDNNKTNIHSNTDPSLALLCLFTSDFHEPQISPC